MKEEDGRSAMCWMKCQIMLSCNACAGFLRLFKIVKRAAEQEDKMEGLCSLKESWRAKDWDLDQRC